MRGMNQWAMRFPLPAALAVALLDALISPVLIRPMSFRRMLPLNGLALCRRRL